MSIIDKLIDQLAVSVPQLDPEPLRDNPPEDEDDVLEWLYESLQEQNLMVYEEWKEYFGEVPRIKSLNNLPLEDADSSFMFQLLSGVMSDCGMGYDSLTYDMPYLEFINHHLKPHKLRLVDLAFENAYIFCVNDDDEEIARLHECLKKAGIGLHPRGAMDEQQATAHIQQLLRGE